MTSGQTVRLVLVVLAFCAGAWLGLKEGLGGLQGSEGQGQRVASAFQLCYGLASIACLVALFARPTWARTAFVTWTAALTITGTLAPVVWGGAPWTSGALAGGATLAIAGLVCWGGFGHLRMKTVDQR